MKKITFLYFTILVQTLFAQNEKVLDVGAAINLRIDIGGSQSTNYTISVVGSLSKNVKLYLIHDDGLNKLRLGALVSAHFGLNLYRGGLGNSKVPSLINDHQLDIFNTFGLALGQGYGARSFDHDTGFRQRPLVTWKYLNAQSLNNPFNYSINAASTFIWNTKIGNKAEGINEKYRAQQIGYIGLTFDDFQMGYYNDGPPFDDWFGLGDAFDRYWTGGGFLEYNLGGIYIGSPENFFTIVPKRIGIYFDKFTGYEKDVYEVANVLLLRNVVYKNPKNSSFNRGIIGAKLAWENDVSLNIAYIDRYNLDVQNYIHNLFSFNSLHPSIYKPYFLFGLSSQVTQNYNINLK
ncbi:MAG: hypothetical protein WAS72_06135 [Saprospiraceae bacterium]